MQKKDKNLLIVTTSFAPENAIGAVRLTSFAKYASLEFRHVTVIAPPIEESTLHDETLQLLNIENIEVFRTKHSIFFLILKFLRNKFLGNKKASEAIGLGKQNKSFLSLIKKYISLVIFKIYTKLKNRDFLSASIKQYKFLIKKTKFDYVFTSYPSYSSHQAGLRIKSQNKSIYWIADFRDPMVYKSISNSKSNQRLQDNFLDNADLAISISNGVRELLLRSSPNAEIKVIYNGFDDVLLESDSSIIDPNYLNFCYMGTLYGGKRDLSKFFEILDKLVSHEEIDKNKILFHYAGSDFSTLMYQAKKHSFEKNLINHGYLNRGQSIEIQSNCDFITVATWNTYHEQGILTGKIFEAFMLKKPVIGIVVGDLANSELKSIIESRNAGIVIESEFLANSEERRIVDLLKEIYIKKFSTPGLSSSSFFQSDVNNFHYQNLFNKLLNYLP